MTIVAMQSHGARRPGRWLRAFGAAALFAWLLAACGGEDDPGRTGFAGTTSTPTVTATPSPSPTAAAPSSYAALDAYRYEVTMSINTAALDEGNGEAAPGAAPLELMLRGARINPDREWTETTGHLGFASLEFESVTIGDERWTRAGEQAWRHSSAAPAGVIPFEIDIRPTSIFGGDWNEAQVAMLEAFFEAHPSSAEVVNGMATRYYRFAMDEFADLFANSDLLTERMSDIEVVFELWVADAYGVPVALVITGTTADGEQALRFALEIFDVNDDSIEVEPPADE